MKLRPWHLAAVAWLLGACRHGGAPAAAPEPSSAVHVPVTKWTLDNGLEVLLHEDHRLPLVAVSVWYHVGALHEVPGRSGFAHLFEHMMFQGSPHVGDDQYFRILQAVGGSDENGTTNFDRTNYFATVPTGELETLLWMESDRMGFLLASLDQKSLANQIDVVRNERRQSIESRPYGLFREAVVGTLFPAPHPYHGNIIGSLEDIGAATLTDVRRFFLRYYTPANATICLAGDITKARAEALVKKYFGSLTGAPRPEPPQVAPPSLSAPKRLEFEEPIGQLTKVSVAWLGPPRFSTDTAALTLLAHVISGTRSARLDRRVSFDNLIAQSVTAYFDAYTAGSIFQIDITLRPDRTPEEAVAAIDATLADLKARPPTADELRRARNAMETGLLFGLQKLGGFSGRAEMLQSYNHYLGRPDRLDWDLDRYRAARPSDLTKVQDTWLTEHRLVAIARPKAASAEEKSK